MATVSGRGRVLKERLVKGAFRFAVYEASVGRRGFGLLIDPSYDKPVSSTRVDTLTVRRAVVPDATAADAEQPT